MEPDARGAIIWSNCKVKMVLPAVSDAETLDLISKLYGTYESPRVTTTKNKDGDVSTSTVMESRPVMAPETLWMLADFSALVVYSNHRPVKALIDPFWERRTVRRAEARAARRVVPAPPPARPPTRGGTPAPEPQRGGTDLPAPTPYQGEQKEDESSG